MAQWRELTDLCKKNKEVHVRVTDLYGRSRFPFKIRSHFAEWIEAKVCELYGCEADSDVYKKIAENAYKELILMISNELDKIRSQQIPDYLEKSLDMQSVMDKLKLAFEGNFITFVEVLKSCIQEEALLIDSCMTDNCDLKRKNKTPDETRENIVIKQSLATLQQRVDSAESVVQDVSYRQSDFVLEYHQIDERIKQQDVQIQAAQNDATKSEYVKLKLFLENDRQKKTRDFLLLRQQMGSDLLQTSSQLRQCLQMIWLEIRKWQNDQKRKIAALAWPSEGALDILDTQCNEAGALLLRMIDYLTNGKVIFDGLLVDGAQDDTSLKLVDVNRELQNDYRQHLKRVFVVDRDIQDRVLKVSSGKSLGFSMSVRMLGGNSLGLGINKSNVAIAIFPEKEIPKGDVFPADPSPITIVNSTERPFLINRGNNSCTVSFHSICLKNVKRETRGKSEELVTEHKYAFVFYTKVRCGRDEIPVKVISLPVILTSQTSQEIMAKGTLIWDAAFSEEDREPFVYKDSVKWSEVANILNQLFKLHTGRELTKEHKKYLARTAFRAKKDEDFDNKLITDKQVIRDRLSGRDFSFWKWVWANMNLVKEHVKDEWQANLIYGFISKEDAKQMLMDCPRGTFLLRFSESNIENSQKCDICGYLTLAVMEMEPKTGQKKLFHVREYLSPKELKEKGLAPILDAMEVEEYAKPGVKKRLPVFLYPNITTDFNMIFGKYLTEREKADDGYKRGKYTIEIFLSEDRRPRHNSSDSAAPSPLSSSMYSPASYEQSPAMCDISENSNGEYDTPDCEPLHVPGFSPRRTAAVSPTYARQPMTIQQVAPLSTGRMDASTIGEDAQVSEELLLEIFDQFDRDGSLSGLLVHDLDGDIMVALE